MRMIINADDLGMSEEVNEMTFALFDRGQITSASLLANGPGFLHAIEGLLRRGIQSVGTHLNLIEFRPLTNDPNLAPLLDANGEFRNNIRHALPSRLLLRGIHHELKAQVARILDAGLSISHFDSHQHSHTLPQLSPVIRRLQREFSARRLRRTKSIYYPHNPSTVAAWGVRSSLQFWYDCVAHPMTTDEFTDIHTFIRAKRHYASDKSLEIMVHAWVPEDVAALCSPEWATIVNAHSLIHYQDLEESP